MWGRWWLGRAARSWGGVRTTRRPGVVRWHLGPWGAGLAGAAYIPVPYHLIDVYARDAAHIVAGDRLIGWLALQADAPDVVAPGFVLRSRDADGTESLNRTVAPGELAAGGAFWRPGVPVTAPLLVRVPAFQPFGAPPGAYRALAVLTPGGDPLLTAGARPGCGDRRSCRPLSGA